MKRHRWTSLVTSLAFAAQVSGCGSTPVRSDQHPQHQSDVSILVASDAGDRLALKTAAGLTRLAVEATWSSGSKQKVPLAVPADANAELVLFAYEIGKGLVPATVSLAPPPSLGPSGNAFFRTFMEGVGQGLAPLVLMTAPIWLLIHTLSKRSAAQASRTAMHQDRCCFVWIEDSQSGEVVAGSLPWEPRNVSDGDTPPASPSFESEDLVNCVVAGRRRWAYRSQCS